jgi:DNA-binding transcriptional MerR regulator
LIRREVPRDEERVGGMDVISIGEFSRRSRLSVKALRLYDELGVLLPARVADASGYRFYDPEQLAAARLIAMMRQLDFPLVTIKELLACDRTDAAERVAAHWSDVEVAHVARRQLATLLVNQHSGKEGAMYDVNTREMPERRLLCLIGGREFIRVGLEDRAAPFNRSIAVSAHLTPIDGEHRTLSAGEFRQGSLPH